MIVAFSVSYNNSVELNGAVSLLSRDGTSSRKARKLMKSCYICQIAALLIEL